MRHWLVWGSFAVFWTVLLEMPVPGKNHLPVADLLSPYHYLIAKSVHVAMYAVLAFLSARLPLSARYRCVLMFFLMAHATATELLQELLEPYCKRGGSLHDVGYDHVGIAIGALLSWKRWTRLDAD